ncbi:uncharacterized protein LOC135150521 [Daucus carota subsp. sativus]|uniref:uncharacterized protein LOC135150521 n=1 Tax=Daucus carota subsp. sativus TaxID=79200 RepID=UPI003083C58A
MDRATQIHDLGAKSLFLSWFSSAVVDTTGWGAEICDTFKFNDVSDEAVKLRLFPFSLKDKAKGCWSNNQGYNQPQQGFQQGPKQYSQAGNSQQYAPKQPYHTPPGFQNHGQLANERPQGNLPSDTEVPGKRDPKEQVQSITLRSGKTTTGPTLTLVQDQGDEPQEIPAEVPSNTIGTNPTVEKDKAIPAAAPMSKPVYPPPPFPRRLKKQQLDKQFALEQMPSYAKFMKGILSKKLKLEELETVALTEECSAVLQQKLPPKLKDPGSFTIPCTIGKFSFDKCLCDLGASINLMPLSIFTQLGLPELKPTNMSLQLADRSITHPRGIIEDVLVKLVFGKACHLPVELEHKAYWALKKLNFDLQLAGEKRMMQLNELEEFRLRAYENNKLYKEKMGKRLVYMV